MLGSRVISFVELLVEVNNRRWQQRAYILVHLCLNEHPIYLKLCSASIPIKCLQFQLLAIRLTNISQKDSSQFQRLSICSNINCLQMTFWHFGSLFVNLLVSAVLWSAQVTWSFCAKVLLSNGSFRRDYGRFFYIYNQHLIKLLHSCGTALTVYLSHDVQLTISSYFTNKARYISYFKNTNIENLYNLI